jgi:hypothetical protein
MGNITTSVRCAIINVKDIRVFVSSSGAALI